MNNNQIIIDKKIKEFIRKYYLNKLLRGAIFFMMITILVFIIYTLLEYFSYFDSTVRTVFFFSYIAIFLFTFFGYILIPLLNILGIGKQLSKEQIADIIGTHFPEIDDKLLNLFQLENLKEEGSGENYELLSAAIDYKIEKIKPFPFIKAISFNKTIKYIKWAAIPVILFVVIFSIKSEVFTDSTKRIVNYSQFYEKPAPYSFVIDQDHLFAFEHEDLQFKIKVVGEETPDQVYVIWHDKKYKCKKLDNTEFSYSFLNLQRNTSFQIVTDEVQSKIYEIQVLPKPVTIGFYMKLSYPSYINKNEEIIENNGNATVPEGTKITWNFYTKNTDSLLFIYHDHAKAIPSSDDNYATTLIAKASFDYAVVNLNQYFTSKDTLKHSISVIKDQYPEIYVQNQIDSIFEDRIYFKGNIKDDYGFSKLQFVYTKYDENSKVISTNTRVAIDINGTNLIQDFYYFFDAATLNLQPGQKIDYYFEVFDNDGVNGSKSTKTSAYSFRIKTMEEIDKELENSSSETKNQLNDLIKESAQLMKDIEKLNQQLLQTNQPSWQEKKKLEKLVNQFNKLKSEIDQLRENQDKQQTIENQFKNYDENIIRKQQELEKRMEDILSDEMKNMLEKMQQMLQNMDKNQMQESMQQMKANTEDINKSLDQQLELFKQLEFEKKMSEMVNKAKKLSEEQQKLSDQTKQKENTKDDLLEQQNKIENQYHQLKEDINQLEQLNKGLEDPNKLHSTQPLQEEIEKNIQNGKNELNKGNRSKASDSQQNAAEKMEEMAEQLEQDMNENELENVSEDIETLRQILDNLVQISFNQEDNMLKTNAIHFKSPAITDVIRNQYTVQNNMKMIDDSLSTLAKRQPSVKPFILKEVTKIRDYLAKAQTNLIDRKTTQASTNQQFVLTSMNNLSLMLAESMKEMKQKQSESKSKCNKSGNGSCSKPGGSGKSKKTSAKELQQQLNRQMEALKRSMEQQGEQQGQKPGQQSGGQSLSEQFARMAAQQEAIRKMIQDYQNQMKSTNGVGDKALDQLMQEMEKTERELVNKTLTQQTINRQQNIETRLLESEKADLKREKEEKRESIEAIQQKRENPPKEWKLDKEKIRQTEMLKTIPVNLNYYYKEKVNQYFYNIDSL